jgi:hypothetical protein
MAKVIYNGGIQESLGLLLKPDRKNTEKMMDCKQQIESKTKRWQFHELGITAFQTPVSPRFSNP